MNNVSVIVSFNFSDVIVLFRPKHLQSKFEDAVIVYDGSVDKSTVSTWVKLQ